MSRFDQWRDLAILRKKIAFHDRDKMLDRHKLKMEFPGGLQERIAGPYKYVTLNGKTVVVDQMASDQEIEDALAKVDAATSAPAPGKQQTGQNASNTAVIPLKAVDEPIQGNIMGTGFIIDEITKIIEDARADVQSSFRAVGASVAGIKDTAKQAHSLAAAIKREDDNLKAKLGRFTNGAPE